MALPWHCQPVGTIKIRGLWCRWRAVCNWLPRSWSSGSYLLISLWRFVWIRPCRMRHICDVGWCQVLPPFIYGGPFCQFFTYQHLIQSGGRHCEVADCLGSDGAMRNYVVQLAGCSDLQNHSAVMDLMICHSQSWIPHFMISSFVVTPHGFCSKAYCKGILLDSPYTILLLLPSVFGPKKGEHSVEWHMDRKDTWLALNQSKAKYLGQTMVPKGSTWALEPPGGSQKKEGNHRFIMVTLQSLACFHPILCKQCWASLNLHLHLIWQPKLHSGWQMMPWSDASKDWQNDHLPHLSHTTSSERILLDSLYTILLLLPSVFGPKKGEHSMEWHTDRKDMWLNWSEAKYLGQTMVPKGSMWALESQRKLLLATVMRRRARASWEEQMLRQDGPKTGQRAAEREKINLLKVGTRWNIGNDRNALIMTFASTAGYSIDGIRLLGGKWPCLSI